MLGTLILSSCGNDFFVFTGTPPGTFAIQILGQSGEAVNGTAVGITIN